MPAFKIDHIALPCFDVIATHRFYTQILECPLVHAQSGSAQAWDAHEFLLLAYGLPDGSTLDFFSYDGISRPADDGLPQDIRHIALAVPGRDDLAVLEDRLKQASVAFWTEVHSVDDRHLYVTDPNGVVLEILAEEDGARRRSPDRDGARRTLDRWLASRSPGCPGPSFGAKPHAAQGRVKPEGGPQGGRARRASVPGLPVARQPRSWAPAHAGEPCPVVPACPRRSSGARQSSSRVVAVASIKRIPAALEAGAGK